MCPHYSTCWALLIQELLHTIHHPHGFREGCLPFLPDTVVLCDMPKVRVILVRLRWASSLQNLGQRTSCKTILHIIKMITQKESLSLHMFITFLWKVQIWLLGLLFLHWTQWAGNCGFQRQTVLLCSIGIIVLLWGQKGNIFTVSHWPGKYLMC